MIALLTGSVVYADAQRAVVDVQGVGYEVFAPTRRAPAAPGPRLDRGGGHHPREHSGARRQPFTLYRLRRAPKSARSFETLLIGVGGVGPKVALACAGHPAALSRAAAPPSSSNDVRTLTRIPGVGKKTAQRIALELKGKLPARALRSRPGAHSRFPTPADGSPPRAPIALATRPGSGSATPRARSTAPPRRTGGRRPAPMPMLPAGERLSASPAGILYGEALMSEDRILDSAQQPRCRRSRPPPPFNFRRVRGPEGASSRTSASTSSAALNRGEALDHVLLAGPPGLGKTSLAYIIAEELRGGACAPRPAPAHGARRRPGCDPQQPRPSREVLFIDEIHRLAPGGRGGALPGHGGLRDRPGDRAGAGRPVGQDAPAPFTLVGATTRSGMLSAPAACPLRHPLHHGLLRAPTSSSPHRAAQRLPASTCAITPDGRHHRAGAPCPRHPPHRQPSAAQRFERLRRGRGRRRHRRLHHRRHRPRPSPGRQQAGSTRWTAASCTPSASQVQRWVLSASTPSPPPSASRATPSKTPASPSCIQQGFIQRTPSRSGGHPTRHRKHLGAMPRSQQRLLSPY